MENKVFKLFNRRLMIKSFLKDHGSLSLEEMRGEFFNFNPKHVLKHSNRSSSIAKGK